MATTKINLISIDLGLLSYSWNDAIKWRVYNGDSVFGKIAQANYKW